MNIREQLLVEHSKSNTQKITSYIGEDQERLSILMHCFFSEEYRVSQRSAMVVSDVFDHQPQLMPPYLKQMIENLNEKNLHIAVKRNTVRILQFISVPEKLQAPLFDSCLSFLIDSKEPIAVKAFSMTVLYNICKQYPELNVEVIPILEDELKHTESAGIRSRGKKVLRLLERLSN